MIRYRPDKLLKRIAPEKKIKRMMKGNLTLNRTALAFVDDIEFISKKDVVTTALRVIKGYKDRAETAEDRNEIKRDPALLIQRVQNEIVTQMTEKIRDKYQGDFYRWLPSDSEEPDPEHQLKYGQVFKIGEGEMPGDRFGCRCGMEILVAQTELDLE